MSFRLSNRHAANSTARLFAMAGLAAGLAVMLGACQFRFSVGRTKEKALHDAAEKAIAEVMSTKGFGPLAPTCETPSDGHAVEGETFGCTATTTTGKTATFTATVTRDGVHVEPTNAISVQRLRALEEVAVGALEDKAGGRLGTENFTCGNEVIVYELNAPITCILVDPETGQRIPAVIRVDGFSDDAQLEVKVGAGSGTIN
jgi:hypothetical protein